MKLIRTQEAVGQVLLHDMTQIIPGEYKGARFHKGHIVREEDIPTLLSMGKENLYIMEPGSDLVHEDAAADRLRSLCQNKNMCAKGPREGKIELFAETDGLFKIRRNALYALNSQDEMMVATRHGDTMVRKGDKLAGMRVIPLWIEEEKLRAAEAVVGAEPILELKPFTRRKAALIITGNEVKSGRIEDRFAPALERILADYGVSVISKVWPGDDKDEIIRQIQRARFSEADIILCTGGMSVDPDDRTPAAIRDSGAHIIRYGAPVLPGAMMMLGYYRDGTPIVGLPGCVMYARSTVFQILLPRILADDTVTYDEISMLGEGGLCLDCDDCRFPNCGFGKGGF